MTFLNRCVFLLVVVLVVLPITACDTIGGWDGGAYAGQPVYEITNKRFSIAAVQSLKNCGIESTAIENLAKGFMLDAIRNMNGRRDFEMTYSDLSRSKHIKITLNQLADNFYRIDCTPA